MDGGSGGGFGADIPLGDRGDGAAHPAQRIALREEGHHGVGGGNGAVLTDALELRGAGKEGPLYPGEAVVGKGQGQAAGEHRHIQHRLGGRDGIDAGPNSLGPLQLQNRKAHGPEQTAGRAGEVPGLRLVLELGGEGPAPADLAAARRRGVAAQIAGGIILKHNLLPQQGSRRG